MSRVLACATLAVVLSFDGHAQQQPPAFKGASELVRIYATVTDRDGRLVTTLTRDAFEIRDEGKPQPITQFDSTAQPIRLIELLDVSGSMEGNLPLLRAASDALFARLRSDDRVKVGSFGAEIHISPEFTKDLTEIRAALPRLIQPDAPTPLWRAIDEAIDAFSDADDTRRVIIVLTDGKDTGPLSFRERPHSQSEVIDHARSKDVMIYGVAMRSRSRQPKSPGVGPGGLQAMLNADLPDPGLARVAEETGGGYLEIRFGEDLGPAFAGVADELHLQYLLGYDPPRRDGKVHDVTVKVNQGGMKPRARKNYVAPKG